MEGGEGSPLLFLRIYTHGGDVIKIMLSDDKAKPTSSQADTKTLHAKTHGRSVSTKMSTPEKVRGQNTRRPLYQTIRENISCPPTDLRPYQD